MIVKVRVMSELGSLTYAVREFTANRFKIDRGSLSLYNDEVHVISFAPGYWLAFWHEDAEHPCEDHES